MGDPYIKCVLGRHFQKSRGSFLQFNGCQGVGFPTIDEDLMIVMKGTMATISSSPDSPHVRLLLERCP